VKRRVENEGRVQDVKLVRKKREKVRTGREGRRAQEDESQVGGRPAYWSNGCLRWSIGRWMRNGEGLVKAR
jgi:hypothetical protein